MFWEEDAALILQMPLRDGEEDFMAWHFDSKGLFSVKQAYKLKRALSESLPEGIDGGQREIANLNERGDERWRRIWSLPCLGKIRHFLWRYAHNTLATKDILSRRGMEIEDHSCFLCNARNETEKHLFVDCNEVKFVWRELNHEHVRIRLTVRESVNEPLDVLWQLHEKDRMEIIIMWWHWWTQRNKVREGEKPLDAKLFAFRVVCTAAEYQENFCKATTSTRCLTGRWTTPPPDFFKFNVDGAYTPGNQHGAWGVVVRNNEGTLVAVRAGRVEHVADAFDTELHAVEKALDLENLEQGKVNVG